MGCDKEDKELSKLKEGYADLYNHFTCNGISDTRALEMIKEVDKDNVVYMDRSLGIKVQLCFQLTWLEENLNWSSLSYSWKKNALWNLGMDTKNNQFYTDVRRQRVDTGEGFKLEMVDVVWGEERLDDKWINSSYVTNCGTNYRHYASDAARDYVWNRKQGFGNK